MQREILAIFWNWLKMRNKLFYNKIAKGLVSLITIIILLNLIE